MDQETSGIHPAPAEFTAEQVATDPILHFFHYAHLPAKLQATSRNFFLLAANLVTTLPRNAERTVALRKLLEAKDAAVRANLPSPTFGQKELPLASESNEDFRTTAQHFGEDEDIQVIERGGSDHIRDGDPPFDG